MDTLYTFGDNIDDYKTESVHFLGLVNSATKFGDNINHYKTESVNFLGLVNSATKLTTIKLKV